MTDWQKDEDYAEYARTTGHYTTKDSGCRETWDSGMQRDTQEGKARFDLLVPEGIPYEAQLLTRWAELMERGARKYDARNWEQANSRSELSRAKSSAFRHFMQWLTDEVDEDHAVAVLFNLMVAETVKYKLEAKKQNAVTPVLPLFTTSFGDNAPGAGILSRLSDDDEGPF